VVACGWQLIGESIRKGVWVYGDESREARRKEAQQTGGYRTQEGGSQTERDREKRRRGERRIE
jgi:hypothetical protein